MVTYFPNLVSNSHFIELLPRQAPTLHVLTNSKKLPVCDNKRIHTHKVFAAISGRGKSSTGWFFGIKLHLVINELGQLMNFLITPANVADNNDEVLRRLLGRLEGRCYAD